jgi:hypothetical protein
VSEMRLRVHDADPERVERIRARCVAVLERRHHDVGSQVSRAAARRGWLEPAIAVGLCLLYLAEAVSRALAMYH